MLLVKFSNIFSPAKQVISRHDVQIDKSMAGLLGHYSQGILFYGTDTRCCLDHHMQQGFWGGLGCNQIVCLSVPVHLPLHLKTWEIGDMIDFSRRLLSPIIRLSISSRDIFRKMLTLLDIFRDILCTCTVHFHLKKCQTIFDIQNEKYKFLLFISDFTMHTNRLQLSELCPWAVLVVNL